MILEIKGIHFSYRSRKVLNDITLGIKEGELLSLVGPNGSGKTTLLKCINKILKPKQGTVMMKGEDVGRMNLKELAKCIGYVPQSSLTSFPSTVFDIVLLGRKPYLTWGVSSEDKEIVSRVLELMKLEDFALRDFNELSGGEKQGVLLARTLAQQPEILLLDELTSNLDLRHQLEVMNLISSVVKKEGISAIIAIHDLNLASRYSDQVVFLKDGEIYAEGEPKSIFTPENIRQVYGVEAIVNHDSGRPHIISIAPINSSLNMGGRNEG